MAVPMPLEPRTSWRLYTSLGDASSTSFWSAAPFWDGSRPDEADQAELAHTALENGFSIDDLACIQVFCQEPMATGFPGRRNDQRIPKLISASSSIRNAAVISAGVVSTHQTTSGC
jgi:hypothetical protein